MISLAYPWLLSLVLLPLAIRAFGSAHRESRPYLTVPYLQTLSELSGQSPREGAVIARPSQPQRLLLILVWCLLIVALARPQWVSDPVVQVLPGRDMLIAIDLSGSMATEDFTDALGNQTDRVSAVKEVMDEFLANREGDRVGLMFFGSAPFMQVPFTDDLDVCRALLGEAQAGMAGPKTMLGDAVGRAITVFEDSDVAEKVLIILADGNDSGSLVPPVKAAQIARDKGIRIHTIGMGDPATVGEDRLDLQTLKTMADVTGGEMFLAMDRDALQEVYDRIEAITPREVETQSYRPVSDLYHWFLGGALGLVLFYHGYRICAHFLQRQRSHEQATAVSAGGGRR